MLSSDSPGSLCQNHQAFLVTLQALFAKVTKLFTKNKSHVQRNRNTTSHAAQPLTLILLTLTTLVRNTIAYAHDCQKMPHTMLSTEIFHPSNALWYRASICPCTSQDRCCNSISKPMRLSFNIMMKSKLLRLIRTSSNSGTSHSRSTICVCSNLMTPCNFSISIIRPMSCSFSASYTALSLLRSLDLSLASILGKTIAKFLDTQTSRFQTGYSGFKLFKQVNFYKHSTHSSVTRQVVGVLTCPNTSLVSPGPTANLSL